MIPIFSNKWYQTMAVILPNVLNLESHKLLLENNSKAIKPSCCPHCGYGTLWGHGCYDRKADRSNPPPEDNLNPIKIPRFYCPSCKKTCSVLPECLPERRWYQWIIQQAAFMFFLQGYSIRTIANFSIPSRSTISRWVRLFKLAYQLISHRMRSLHPEIGYHSDFTDFWLYCFLTFSLSYVIYVIGGWWQIFLSLKEAEIT